MEQARSPEDSEGIRRAGVRRGMDRRGGESPPPVPFPGRTWSDVQSGAGPQRAAIDRAGQALAPIAKPTHRVGQHEEPPLSLIHI